MNLAHRKNKNFRLSITRFTVNRPSENVAQFKYLGVAVTNQTLMFATIQFRSFCLLVYYLKS
jgi:hypothetical protein